MDLVLEEIKTFNKGLEPTFFSDFSPPLLSPKDFIYLQNSLDTP
jgi:hypothetical protein